MSSIDPRARFTETITVKRSTSFSNAGDPILGAAFTARARVERATDDQAEGEGRKANDQSKVITDTPLFVGDHVWFAEDNTATLNTARKVLTVKQNRALDGTIISYSASV